MKKSTLIKMTRPHPVKKFLDRINYKSRCGLNNTLLYMSEHPFFEKFVKVHIESSMHPYQNLSNGVMNLGTVSDTYLTWTATGIIELHEFYKNSYITILDRGCYFKQEYCKTEEILRCKMSISRISAMINGDIKEICKPIGGTHSVCIENTKLPAERVTVSFDEMMGYNLSIPINIPIGDEDTSKRVTEYVESIMKNNYKLYLEVFNKCVTPNDLSWLTPLSKIETLEKETL